MRLCKSSFADTQKKLSAIFLVGSNTPIDGEKVFVRFFAVRKNMNEVRGALFLLFFLCPQSHVFHETERITGGPLKLGRQLLSPLLSAPSDDFLAAAGFGSLPEPVDVLSFSF